MADVSCLAVTYNGSDILGKIVYNFNQKKRIMERQMGGFIHRLDISNTFFNRFCRFILFDSRRYEIDGTFKKPEGVMDGKK